MKININNHELELLFSIRMMINYEQKFNKPIDFEHINDIDICIGAFWACVNASLEKQKIDEVVKLDDFKDWIDDNGGIFTTNKFGLWVTKKLQEQWEYINEQDKKEEEEKPKSSKPKKAKD